MELRVVFLSRLKPTAFWPNDFVRDSLWGAVFTEDSIHLSNVSCNNDKICTFPGSGSKLISVV